MHASNIIALLAPAIAVQFSYFYYPITASNANNFYCQAGTTRPCSTTTFVNGIGLQQLALIHHQQQQQFQQQQQIDWH